MLLSHQENEKRRKGAKCDIRFFHRTSGYGEARIFVLFSEFTSGKAVKVFKKLVHKFCAYLRILFCVWTFVDFSIIYMRQKVRLVQPKKDRIGVFGVFYTNVMFQWLQELSGSSKNSWK